MCDFFVACVLFIRPVIGRNLNIQIYEMNKNGLSKSKIKQMERGGFCCHGSLEMEGTCWTGTIYA